MTLYVIMEGISAVESANLVRFWELKPLSMGEAKAGEEALRAGSLAVELVAIIADKFSVSLLLLLLLLRLLLPLLLLLLL